MCLKYLIIVTLVAICSAQKIPPIRLPPPAVAVAPCKDNFPQAWASLYPGGSPAEENQYNLTFNADFPIHTIFELGFDSDASLTLLDDDIARIYATGDQFRIEFFEASSKLNLKVAGPPRGGMPYLNKLRINFVEFCKEPRTGYFDNYIVGARPSASVSLSAPDSSCGRRKVEHVELIVNGQPTKPGDWPWHVALYRLVRRRYLEYICGGTLISHTMVLTAAHCVTVRSAKVLPEILNVVLGKYNLVGGDISAEERKVHEIIVHENYNGKTLDNDIALLQLSSEATFNDYVQPACILTDYVAENLRDKDILGTVVGWGFDQTDKLSNQLQQSKMPIISEGNCIKSHPAFFSQKLNKYKFCAGYRNGTSACNGDSGGGFMVFVPDTKFSGSSSTKVTGSWYIRGIVSSSIARQDEAICDSSQYVIFTDVGMYKDWLDKYLE